MLDLGLKDEKDVVAGRRGSGTPGGRKSKDSHCVLSCGVRSGWTA